MQQKGFRRTHALRRVRTCTKQCAVSCASPSGRRTRPTLLVLSVRLMESNFAKKDNVWTMDVLYRSPRNVLKTFGPSAVKNMHTSPVCYTGSKYQTNEENHTVVNRDERISAEGQDGDYYSKSLVFGDGHGDSDCNRRASVLFGLR
eukprot:GHVS01058650.1.p2 GENE.GHVS01058650.1~~GHVS01058650.1.p2  ORF type:complete len:146 (+),score=4.83 GHVS01058650.1:98-535(+)